MKQNIYIKLSAIIALGISPVILTSCGDKKEENKADTNTETSAAKSYPLETCLVSGEKLGSMGEPHVFVHNGQEIKMCCDKCVPKFNKDPEKYLAKLKQGDATTPKKMDSDHGDHDH
jgi:hypothetical protein